MISGTCLPCIRLQFFAEPTALGLLERLRFFQTFFTRCFELFVIFQAVFEVA
jgi:hypothetical protein